MRVVSCGKEDDRKDVAGQTIGTVGATMQNRLTLKVERPELTPENIERLQTVHRSNKVGEKSRKRWVSIRN